TEEFGYIQTFFHVTDQFLRRLLAGLQEVVARSDARCPSKATRGVARCFEAKLFRRVGIQQVRLQNAIFDDQFAACGDALTVERARAESPGNRAVVDHGYVVGRDLLPEFAGEE